MRIFLLIFFLAGPCLPALAQQPDRAGLPGFDTAAILMGAEDVMLRAPDRDVDALFQAVHEASTSEAEARVLCELFDPAADRSLAGLQRAAGALGPASRSRLAEAAIGIAVAGLQSPLQPYDPVVADRVLRRAGVTAALLHEGFSEGMAAAGEDVGSRKARCRSFRQLVGVLQDFDLAERAAATRYLMIEGLVGMGR